nr:hypothetical protein [Candidatus Freyarchaeota archaeon]
MIMNLFKQAATNSVMGNYKAAIEYYKTFIDKASKCYNDLKSGSKIQSTDEKGQTETRETRKIRGASLSQV